jgi:coronin-7
VLYLTGKGDRAIQFVEVTEREPWFVEGLRYTGEQIKGSCLVPKRAMDVMQCEVGIDLSLDRLFMLMPVRIRILP